MQSLVQFYGSTLNERIANVIHSNRLKRNRKTTLDFYKQTSDNIAKTEKRNVSL